MKNKLIKNSKKESVGEWKLIFKGEEENYLKRYQSYRTLAAVCSTLLQLLIVLHLYGVL